MDRIEALLQQGDSGSETPTSETSIMARVRDMVDDRLWEVQETESVIEEMVDDKFLLWKIDFQDWLEDQSREDIPRHIQRLRRFIHIVGQDSRGWWVAEEDDTESDCAFSGVVQVSLQAIRTREARIVKAMGEVRRKVHEFPYIFGWSG
ncbi:hypothetical protein NpNSSI1_00003200 [Neofusicoccum parvum]|nr:hypothetical protein NpNSSI1_00003200 [Neofusicoccum parvum]